MFRFSMQVSSCKSENVILHRTQMVLSLPFVFSRRLLFFFRLNFFFLSIPVLLFGCICFRSQSVVHIEPKHLYTGVSFFSLSKNIFANIFIMHCLTFLFTILILLIKLVFVVCVRCARAIVLERAMAMAMANE